MYDQIEQLNQLLDRCEHPLIVLPPNNNIDAIATALAIKQYLTTHHTPTEIVCDSFIVTNSLAYLPGINQILPELFHLHKFTIKVDVSKAKIDTLSYDLKDNWLSINLTPRYGSITKNDLRTLQSTFKYDLIITLGAADLETLGEVFFNNTDLFYRTPIINFDHKASNEHYGNLNIVELSATSLAEIIFEYFKRLKYKTDEPIATSLLTGMIASTRSFKTPSVTPTTLNLASELMRLGADREKIVKNLYRTKTIATLKLWGQALTGLQTDQQYHLVWTQLTQDDFKKAGVGLEAIPELINELIMSSPEASLILVITEDEQEKNKIHARLNVDKHYDAEKILRSFSPQGGKQSAEIILNNTNLSDATNKILNRIRETTKITNSFLN